MKLVLMGAKGTGKTMACRALAKECGARMIQLQASTIQDWFVSVTLYQMTLTKDSQLRGRD
jgi:SpoVK/Ycf46/Vps4 family AAA+-type ATPase